MLARPPPRVGPVLQYLRDWPTPQKTPKLLLNTFPFRTARASVLIWQSDDSGLHQKGPQLVGVWATSSYQSVYDCMKSVYGCIKVRK